MSSVLSKTSLIENFTSCHHMYGWTHMQLFFRKQMGSVMLFKKASSFSPTRLGKSSPQGPDTSQVFYPTRRRHFHLGFHFPWWKQFLSGRTQNLAESDRQGLDLPNPETWLSLFKSILCYLWPHVCTSTLLQYIYTGRSGVCLCLPF